MRSDRVAQVKQLVRWDCRRPQERLTIQSKSCQTLIKPWKLPQSKVWKMPQIIPNAPLTPMRNTAAPMMSRLDVRMTKPPNHPPTCKFKAQCRP